MTEEEKKILDKLINQTDEWSQRLETVAKDYSTAISNLESVRNELVQTRQKVESFKNSGWYTLLIEYKPVISFIAGVLVLGLVILALDKYTDSPVNLYHNSSGINLSE